MAVEETAVQETIFMILVFIAFVWVCPILVILFSNKTRGAEKLAWLLAVLFISWFAWIFYWLLAPLKRKDS